MSALPETPRSRQRRPGILPRSQAGRPPKEGRSARSQLDMQISWVSPDVRQIRVAVAVGSCPGSTLADHPGSTSTSESNGGLRDRHPNRKTHRIAAFAGSFLGPSGALTQPGEDMVACGKRPEPIIPKPIVPGEQSQASARRPSKYRAKLGRPSDRAESPPRGRAGPPK